MFALFSAQPLIDRTCADMPAYCIRTAPQAAQEPQHNLSLSAKLLVPLPCSL